MKLPRFVIALSRTLPQLILDCTALSDHGYIPSGGSAHTDLGWTQTMYLPCHLDQIAADLHDLNYKTPSQ